jgi:hypothetical protein
MATVRKTVKRGGSKSRDKGARFEREFVERLKSAGIPSMRVLGSGAFSTAKSDVKVGVNLNPDGSYPPADEGVAHMRAECKNREDNKALDLRDKTGLKVVAEIVMLEKDVPARFLQHLQQDKVSKFVALRFSDRTSKGAKAPIGIYMDFEDFLDLFKEAFKDGHGR